MSSSKTIKRAGDGYELYTDGTAALLIKSKTGTKRVYLGEEDIPALYHIFGYLTVFPHRH